MSCINYGKLRWYENVIKRNYSDVYKAIVEIYIERIRVKYRPKEEIGRLNSVK